MSGLEEGDKILIMEDNRPIVLTIVKTGLTYNGERVVWTKEREGYIPLNRCYTKEQIQTLFE
ncbi:MAG: hypothetical protein ACOC5T_06175 [Elusimicrobiota bacterium]